MQVLAARRFQPDHRPQEIGAAGDQRRGDQPPLDQPAGAVEVGDHRLHQFGTLGDAADDAVPFPRVDQQGDGRDGPGPLVRLADDAESHADIGGVAAHPFADMV